MATTIHIDQIDTVSLVFFDSTGATVPTPDFDAPPVWINSVPAAITDAVSADATSDVLTPVAIGQTSNLSCTLSVSGTQLSFNADYTVIAGAIAGFKFVDTFSPKAATAATAVKP